MDFRLGGGAPCADPRYLIGQHAGSVYNMEVLKKNLFLDPHTVQTLHSCFFSIDQPIGISNSNLGNTQYYTFT